MTPDILLWLLLLSSGALMLAVPHLSSGGSFFAVRLGLDFRASEAGRRALRLYNRSVVAGLLAGAVFIFAYAAVRNFGLMTLGALAPELAGLAAFYRNYYRLRPHAAAPEGVREADLLPAH